MAEHQCLQDAVDFVNTLTDEHVIQLVAPILHDLYRSLQTLLQRYDTSLGQNSAFERRRTSRVDGALFPSIKRLMRKQQSAMIVLLVESMKGTLYQITRISTHVPNLPSPNAQRWLVT